MKTLAFLIDEMQNAKGLIHYAALLAKDLKAKVHIWYIQYPYIQSPYGSIGAEIPPDPELLQETADEIKKKVAEFIKDIEAENSGIPSIEFKSEIGDASAILKEKVENKVYDMVMLQGHAEQGFLLQNSAVMGIVRTLFCPVWIIPPATKYQAMKKIIYATDYKEEDVSTLKRLTRLAKPFSPGILTLHITDDEQFRKKLLKEGFDSMIREKVGYENVTVKVLEVEEGMDEAESFANQAKSENANLIVVLKENRNFFERLFKSSFTAELVKQTQLPILVFHQAK